MTPKLALVPRPNRKIALCYIRQSYTRDADDVNSPDRQRANIEAVCKTNGWQPEWYTDAEGHKSGRFETNRPGWLALKERIGDPDIVAVIANDFSRLHRKMARMSDLLDDCERFDVRLIQAAPGRDFDTSTPQGRMYAQFVSMYDENFANDMSFRQKDSIRHRKENGKVIGLAPFGAMRDAHGYLTRATAGAWQLPMGDFVAGERDAPPVPNAKWRSYARCAARILILYSWGGRGYEKVAARMNADGWPFCDRKGQPRPITDNDVRRVLSNWPEYGGAVTEKRGRDKQGKNRAPYRYTIEEVVFQPAHIVFPLKLLIKVAQMRLARTVKRPDHGVIQKAHPYPLRDITFCAHCERRAIEQNNPKLRTSIHGHKQGTVFRYRHKGGIPCGATNRSVPCQVYEDDFGRLLRLLTVNPEGLFLMQEWVIQTERAAAPDEVDLETQKSEALALCQRKIDAAVFLFGEGRISREEYLHRLEKNEREIEHWQSRTNDTQKSALELALCVNLLDKMVAVWETGDDEDKQGLARSLFTEVIYNLDTRRIVDFKLKPWAERYMMLRASLYPSDDDVATTKNETAPALKGMEQDVPPRGRGMYPRLFRAQFSIMRINPPHPKIPEFADKQMQRMKAKVLREEGHSYPEIAQQLNISLGAAWALINKAPN